MMANSKQATFERYVSDVGKLLQESAVEVKRARDSASGSDRDYETGRLMGYNEIICLMQQQAVAFGLTFKEIGLEGVDPDNDLV